MKKILTVCANGDKEINLQHTKAVVGKLLEMRIIDDTVYEHHSVNPIAPKDPLVYSKHLVEKFGEKEGKEKYSVIIFQYCNCCYASINQIILEHWKKTRPRKEFNYFYNDSPFYYKNIVDILANSLEDGGLFINSQNCYYSGSYKEPVNNLEKLRLKFIYLNTFTMLKMDAKYDTMDTFDIWKKK